MIKSKLNKLSQEVVNQIAAGEVIERPSSVVKELVDNAIDAEATKIVIKIRNGGMESIEIVDDGYGIPKENIQDVFNAHTTSKIESVEDLNTLMSMGFRGEALSTISSVAKVTLVSKFVEESVGNELRFDENGKPKIGSAAKENGTSIKVENLFYNIPARKKYLKASATEYRKIYEILNRYFLVYQNIHFVLEKDGKVVEDLSKVKGSQIGDITTERVSEVLGKTFAEKALKLYYEGSGISVKGFVAHPSTHKSKVGQSYIFVNNRPITDRGIMRAVYEGYARYLPFGEKTEFVISITINPELVDVNVHPRKEEVRFENPFRVYSAIEEAVKHTLEKELSFDSTRAQPESNFTTLRDTFNKKSSTSGNYNQGNIYSGYKSKSVADSLLFSKELLKANNSEMNFEHANSENEEYHVSKIFQIFSKYIVIEFDDEKLWIIDQHAAAERINFEKLLNRTSNEQNLQNLLVPTDIEFTKQELLFLEDSKDFFQDLGFRYEVEKDHISIKTVPAEFAAADFFNIFKEIFSLEDSLTNLSKDLSKRKEDILATIACHGSVRSGQKLSYEEMLNLFKELSKCNNPYSCPHGRPAVWRLSIEEIDHNFERTY
ncbi:MAG: DNA mismatch repair endonuclease MutL [Candidatus Dojkabacteria bacterium]